MKTATCDYCNTKTIVVHRKYSGELICTDCFTKRIEKNIFQTISKYKMLEPQDQIVVGVSGGKDSLALLYNLIKIQENNYQSKPIIAVTIDEGIQNYRTKSTKNAIEFCKKYGIEHIIVSFKEKTGKSLDEIVELKNNTAENKYACNFCATFRRRLLNETAKELGADVLAMGHNLTDIAETFLMNILFKRFKLIANQYMFKEKSKELQKFFVKRITPLMKIPEEEIFLYSNLKKIDYYPSHCPYREKDPILRKRVLEFIQECKKFSPETEFNLLNGFLEMSEILSNNYKSTSYNTCKECGYPCGKANLCLYCTYLKGVKE
ncbi:MAG: adenine nucleotide alpha hydrolase family protein [Candidatus Lokiarchaeota archaeon]|nr:adenine nucleotide alpha hydrolase family protein [Candidatus Lokiarchaeota archaeon]